MPKAKTAKPTPAQLVRQARKAAGLSQVELARKAGVSQTAISKLEGGDTSQLSSGYLIVLAAVLDLDARDLDPTLEGVYHKIRGHGGSCPACGRPWG